jgi:hypothetical protein
MTELIIAPAIGESKHAQVWYNRPYRGGVRAVKLAALKMPVCTVSTLPAFYFFISSFICQKNHQSESFMITRAE